MTGVIHIVGLGPGGEECLSQGVLGLLRQSSVNYLRTGTHPVVASLIQEGIKFKTFDYLYENAEDFDQVYQEICDKIIQEASKGPLVYAVPGHPLVAERSVQKLIEAARNKGLEFKIYPAMSFLDVIFPLVGVDPCNGLKIIDALEVDKLSPDPLVGNLIVQVYSRSVASEVKLSLMEIYPDEFNIALIKAAGVPELEKIAWMPLFELDRQDWIDHLTSVYVPPNLVVKEHNGSYTMDRLLDVMATLRGADGCPWDREQSHQSLKKYLVEETYEVLEAIEQGNMYKVCEELGDLLLQVIFHAQIAQENNDFEFGDVVKGLTDKLLRRHPHVFGDAVANTSTEVIATWEAVKKQEKAQEGLKESYLSGVPEGLPALLRAEKLQKKAAKIGFDWPDYRGALGKVREELAELEVELKHEKVQYIKEELGDLLFSLVNLSRLLQIDPEDALGLTISKFRQRFTIMEQIAGDQGVDLADLKLGELDNLWEKAKETLKKIEKFTN